MIITHITSQPDLWNEMASPPILVSKANVMIGYNPIYEYAALPDVERIVAAVGRSIATKHERAAAINALEPTATTAEFTPGAAMPAPSDIGKGHVQSITVPVM